MVTNNNSVKTKSKLKYTGIGINVYDFIKTLNLFKDNDLNETYAVQWADIIMNSEKKNKNINSQVYKIVININDEKIEIIFDIYQIKKMISTLRINQSYLSREFILKHCLMTFPDIDENINYGDEPIIVCPFPSSKSLLVIDGNHRLNKSLSLNKLPNIVLISERIMCDHNNFGNEISFKVYSLLNELNCFKKILNNNSKDLDIYKKSFIFSKELQFSILDDQMNNKKLDDSFA